MSRLGRGLAAIIPQSDRDASPRRPVHHKTRDALKSIPLDDIRPNPDQPRINFRISALEELAESIRNHGIITPLLVRRDDIRGHGYILIAGERRLRASGIAGLEVVPCWVRERIDTREQLEVALVENIQREDLDPIETGESYRRLVDDFGMTQAEVARKVGKDRATVANSIRLLRLPMFAIEALRDGNISAGHGKALLALPDEQQLKRAMNKVIDECLSVRATERLVSGLLSASGLRKPGPSPVMQKLGERLTQHLGARVKVEGRARSHKGRIVIEYTSRADLERLVGSLTTG